MDNQTRISTGTMKIVAAVVFGIIVYLATRKKNVSLNGEPNPKIMKTSVNKIANYVIENFNFSSPSTNDRYTIYVNKTTGKINHTTGSSEFRDDNQQEVMVIEFLNEYAPYTKKSVREMVTFGLRDSAPWSAYEKTGKW